MIKTFELSEVRGVSDTFTFDRLNFLRGRNGARKSTIKEAICYLYAGTDSSGARSPTHLITKGVKALRITLTTDRGVSIVRTLTQEGNQSLSILRGDVRTPLNQAELSSLLGASPDTFLAIFQPGFFLGLPAKIQLAVLAEVLPPVDRVQLLSEIAGFPLAEHETRLIDLSKRADLAGARLTEWRRATQRELDQKTGQLKHLLDRAQAPGSAPAEPVLELQRLDQLERLKEIWRDYIHRVNAANTAAGTRQQVELRNSSKELEAKAVRAELAGLVIPEVQKPEDLEPKIRALSEQRQPPPAAPIYHSTVAGDRCPSCGQVVGSKHRAQVEADNAKLRAVWEGNVETVKAHNASVDKQLWALKEEGLRHDAAWRAQADARNKAVQRKHQLEAKLSTLTPETLPGLLPEPTKPEEKYDEKEVDRLRVVKGNYLRAVGAYDAAVKSAERAAADATRLDGEVASLQGNVARAESLESALQRLPQEELARQSEALRLGGYRIGVGEDGLVFETEDGWPYRALSTGQRMLAGIHLSQKLNELLRAKTGRSVGAIFVDDKDLLDHFPDVLGMPGVQVFVAQVTNAERLEVEAKA